VKDLGDGPTILLQTDWLDAYKLLAGSIRLGIQPYFDRGTAQTRISGYDLIEAGMVNEDGEVTVTLTEDERCAQGLSDPPTVEEARNGVMSLYIDALEIEVRVTADAKLAGLYGKLIKRWPVA